MLSIKSPYFINLFAGYDDQLFIFMLNIRRNIVNTIKIINQNKLLGRITFFKAKVVSLFSFCIKNPFLIFLHQALQPLFLFENQFAMRWFADKYPDVELKSLM
jgi:hypothetical protein